MSMNSSNGCAGSACLPLPEQLRSGLLTAQAIAALAFARLSVAAIPFGRWRDTLGGAGAEREFEAPNVDARHFAAHVERAAKLLPLSTRCLPRAMALSWILRRNKVGHTVVFAVRPASLRNAHDRLHAWVEVAGEKVIGDLPGPWIETLRLGS